MSPLFQSMSVKSAEILAAKLEDIQESGVLSGRYIDPEGPGDQVLGAHIRFLNRQIDTAKRINGVVGSEEIKIVLSHGNEVFMINKMLKMYEEATNV